MCFITVSIFACVFYRVKNSKGLFTPRPTQQAHRNKTQEAFGVKRPLRCLNTLTSLLRDGDHGVVPDHAGHEGQNLRPQVLDGRGDEHAGQRLLLHLARMRVRTLVQCCRRGRWNILVQETAVKRENTELGGIYASSQFIRVKLQGKREFVQEVKF